MKSCTNTQENSISTASTSLLSNFTGKKRKIAELALANVKDSEIAKQVKTSIGYVWKIKSELKKTGVLTGATLDRSKYGPEDQPILEDMKLPRPEDQLQDLRLEELGDEELKGLSSQVKEAERKAEVSRLKYLARQEKDRLEAQASKYAQLLEEHKALSDASKLSAYVEKTLAQYPSKLNELKNRLESFGLTLKEALRDELEITADDYKGCQEFCLKYTGKPYHSLAEHIIGYVDAWLKEQRMEERKSKLKPWLDSHPPDYRCPECGSQLEYTESGDLSCLSLVKCGWKGYYLCPNCKSRMRYDSNEKGLICTNSDCWLIWK